MATAKKTPEVLDIIEVTRGRMECLIVGESPLICNAMSNHARHELLLPSGRKTAAQKANSLKHDPMREFNESIYRSQGEDDPTLVLMPATAFKKAMMGAAVDIPGTAKAKIGRLLYVVGDYVSIYGTPQIMLSVTRNQDQNRTPDVRTRCILPVWAARFTIEYTEPLLRGAVITRLLAAAGQMQGVGDWRVEKGSGNYGRFRLANEGDPQFDLTTQTAGRDVQVECMRDPAPFDSETEQLLSWFDAELRHRGHKQAA